MTIEKTFDTLILWLNSCVTDEQINLVVEAADRILLDRSMNSAEDKAKALNLFADISLAAGVKKNLPATVIIPESLIEEMKRGVDIFTHEGGKVYCTCNNNRCTLEHLRERPKT